MRILLVATPSNCAADILGLLVTASEKEADNVKEFELVYEAAVPKWVHAVDSECVYKARNVACDGIEAPPIPAPEFNRKYGHYLTFSAHAVMLLFNASPSSAMDAITELLVENVFQNEEAQYEMYVKENAFVMDTFSMFGISTGPGKCIVVMDEHDRNGEIAIRTLRRVAARMPGVVCAVYRADKCVKVTTLVLAASGFIWQPFINEFGRDNVSIDQTTATASIVLNGDTLTPILRVIRILKAPVGSTYMPPQVYGSPPEGFSPNMVPPAGFRFNRIGPTGYGAPSGPYQPLPGVRPVGYEHAETQATDQRNTALEEDIIDTIETCLANSVSAGRLTADQVKELHKAIRSMRLVEQLSSDCCLTANATGESGAIQQELDKRVHHALNNLCLQMFDCTGPIGHDRPPAPPVPPMPEEPPLQESQEGFNMPFPKAPQ